MKRFIVDDDKKTVGKALKGLELAYRKDHKLTLIELMFSMTSYKNLTNKEVSNLSNTAQDFFHLVNSFIKNEKITNFVNMWMQEDPLQVETTSTCGPFQIISKRTCFFWMKTAKYTPIKN